MTTFFLRINHFALAACAALACAMPAQAAIAPGDKAALIAFYDAAGGDQWEASRRANWKSAYDPCDPVNGWAGVRCDSVDPNAQRVTELKVAGTGMTGTLSPAVSQLTELRVLMLIYNRISPHTGLAGAVPDLSALTHLQELHLVGQNFSSMRGGNLASLVNLQYLHLQENRRPLNHALPDISRMHRLIYFTAYGSGFTGQAPDISNLRNLMAFRIQGNRMTGDLTRIHPPSMLRSMGGATVCPNHFSKVDNRDWDNATDVNWRRGEKWHDLCTLPPAAATPAPVPALGQSALALLAALMGAAGVARRRFFKKRLAL